MQLQSHDCISDDFRFNLTIEEYDYEYIGHGEGFNGATDIIQGSHRVYDEIFNDNDDDDNCDFAGVCDNYDDD